MNQVQQTQMNLGTLTQFERSESYVPQYRESRLKVADEFRDIDPEARSDVRAITHQSHVEITFISKE